MELALLASADSGMDPIDAAIRKAATGAQPAQPLRRLRFSPFDPAQKMSEAQAADVTGPTLRIVKGAFGRISALAPAPPDAQSAAAALADEGYRVLAVAAGPPEKLTMAGLIAFSDPPRPEARALIAELTSIGIRTVMVTGDAAPTARVVAHTVGLEGAVSPPGPVRGTR